MEESKKKLIEFKKWLHSPDFDKSVLRSKIHDVLYETQIDCFDRQIELLEIGHVVANVSAARSGKTLVAALTAIYRGQPIFPIYPKNIAHVWKSEIEIIGGSYWKPEQSKPKRRSTKGVSDHQGASVGDVCGISYSMLRGKRSKNKIGCNNSILMRDADDNFFVTPAFRSALNDGAGLVVVYDEIQDAKNPERLIQKALSAISEEIAKSGKSKLIIQSASPFCKPEYVEMFPRLAGVMDGIISKYDEATKKIIPYGLKQLIEYCERLDMELTSKIVPDYITSSTEQITLYNLTTKVLIPNISVAIKKRIKLHAHTQENRFYAINGEPLQQMHAIDQKYRRSKGMCAGTGNIDQLLKSQNEYDRESELIKCTNIIYEQVKNIHTRMDSKAKFPIFVNFRESATVLYEMLNRDFPGKAAVLNGTVEKDDDRVAILNRFNEDNDDLIFLIGSAEICGVGKDFGDIHGGRRRISFICPNTNFIEAYQASFRANHPDAKSDSWAINVYIDNIPTEMSKLKTNIDKANTVQDSIGQIYAIEYSHTRIVDATSPFDLTLPPSKSANLTNQIHSPSKINELTQPAAGRNPRIAAPKKNTPVQTRKVSPAPINVRKNTSNTRNNAQPQTKSNTSAPRQFSRLNTKVRSLAGMSNNVARNITAPTRVAIR